jgi:hypothetical protein
MSPPPRNHWRCMNTILVTSVTLIVLCFEQLYASLRQVPAKVKLELQPPFAVIVCYNFTEQSSTNNRRNFLRTAQMSSSSAQQKDTPVMAQAVPVPTYAQPAVVVEAVPAQTDNNVGICRRCRQPFVRRPGVNDGQAQYYRCDNCEQFRLQDIIVGSCVVC